MVGLAYCCHANPVCDRLIVGRLFVRLSRCRWHHSGGYFSQTCFSIDHACWNGRWYLGLYHWPVGDYQEKGEGLPSLFIYLDWWAFRNLPDRRTGIPALRASLLVRPDFFRCQKYQPQLSLSVKHSGQQPSGQQY